MYDPNNIFAMILRGDVPALKVHENSYACAFMDVMPQSDGHTLVVPRAAACDLFDIDSRALAESIKVVQQVAAAIRSAFQPAGVTIAQLNGSVAGQSVLHIHFHVIPHYEGQLLKGIARAKADHAVLAKHADRIRKVMSGLGESMLLK